jgi:hypothetical protein
MALASSVGRLGIVEQLAVEDDDDAAVLVGDRLAASARPTMLGGDS